MRRKSLPDDIDDFGESNETTEATLVTLTQQIKDFVREATLDSRCAAKLIQRLKKEADTILDSGKITKLGSEELKKAFDAVDTALRNHDAKLLVTANAALRATDNATVVR
jgi:hypothetical protein